MQKFLSNWKAAWELVESEQAFASVTSQMVDQLCSLLGFTRLDERAYKGLIGYVVRAPALRLRIPPRFPIIFLPRHRIGEGDLDALRERLFDRPDLYDDACRLHLVGQHMQDRGQWLQRVLQRLQELRLAAERQALKEQLAAADAEQAVALLRRWQQTHRGVQGSPGL